MNRVSLLIGMVCVLSLAAGTGCLGDAPHDNPFDPNSEDFVREGGVSGLVTNRTGAPLPEAEVRLVSGPSSTQFELLARTDSQGEFEITGAAEGSGYRLLVHKDGYDDEMLEALEIKPGIVEELSALRLNALPVITNTAFRTIHISRWWPGDDLFFLEVNADIADADGPFDIERVWFEIPDLSYSITLDAQVQPAGRYDKLIRDDSLSPPVSLQSLLGKTLRLNVRDKQGIVVTSDAGQLVRVLEDTPDALEPTSDAVLDNSRPRLIWQPFPPRFDFTYRIDVFRKDANFQPLVRQIDNIPMDVTSLQLESLPIAAYFWTVTVIDAFGNQSRSKQAGFLIP